MKRLWLALALVLVACGSPPPAPAPSEIATPAVSVEGPIAARVDGEPIALSEVEETARASGLTPMEALHRLEQERALLHRAAHVSLHADAEADDATRRASVQALLHARVEGTIDESTIDRAEIAARYEASRGSWTQPERRASVHVLAAPQNDDARPAAERFIRGCIARLAAAADPVVEAHAIEAEGAVGRTFTLTVEALPPATRQTGIEEPYLAALFAIPSAPGVAPEPVVTSYGIHAVVLTSIEPSFEMSLAEATPILRRQLVAEHRGAALDALTRSLAAHTSVQVDERVAAVAFAAPLEEPPAGMR